MFFKILGYCSQLYYQKRSTNKLCGFDKREQIWSVKLKTFHEKIYKMR